MGKYLVYRYNAVIGHKKPFSNILLIKSSKKEEKKARLPGVSNTGGGAL
jgi:hypothetical protein